MFITGEGHALSYTEVGQEGKEEKAKRGKEGGKKEKGSTERGKMQKPISEYNTGRYYISKGRRTVEQLRCGRDTPSNCSSTSGSFGRAEINDSNHV